MQVSAHSGRAYVARIAHKPLASLRGQSTRTMRVSEALAAEFVTVDAVLATRGTTRCVAAFALPWIKAQKQVNSILTVEARPGLTRTTQGFG